MRIIPTDRNLIIIHTINGSIHVEEDPVSGQTTIYYHDHATIRISGKHKNVPLISIDTDEYPTRLVIKENESKWEDKIFITKIAPQQGAEVS